MKRTEVVVDGALTEDGQLILDERPNLPPGRVKVVVQAPERPGEASRTMWDVLDEIHAAQRARGFSGRSLAEAVVEVRALRDEWDERERVQEAHRRSVGGLATATDTGASPQ